jgi:hypothetical protein
MPTTPTSSQGHTVRHCLAPDAGFGGGYPEIQSHPPDSLYENPIPC